MNIRPTFAVFAGAALVVVAGYLGSRPYAAQFVESRQTMAREAIAVTGGEPVKAHFLNNWGAATRHPRLSHGNGLDESTRARVAGAVASIPGVGGVFWADGTVVAESGDPAFTPLHCQDDVDGLLRTRTIRFEEGSSELTATSAPLLDEVAEALRPCLGSRIAVTGHTDKSGAEEANLALSFDRARAVREELVGRGIPRDSLRATGVGSSSPAEGLTPEDPANRRIEFSVIMIKPLVPTPVDTPGAR
ncbi:MAG: OmpA family protein [Qipengyuania sp.]